MFVDMFIKFGKHLEKPDDNAMRFCTSDSQFR